MFFNQHTTVFPDVSEKISGNVLPMRETAPLLSLMGWAHPLCTRVSGGRNLGGAGTQGAAVALPCLDECPKRSLKHLKIHCSIMPCVLASFGKVLMQSIMEWLE